MILGSHRHALIRKGLCVAPEKQGDREFPLSIALQSRAGTLTLTEYMK